MKKKKNRLLSAALAVVLGVGTLLPVANVFAQEYYPATNTPYKFHLANYATPGGPELVGAKYDLKQTGKMLKTGSIEAMDPSDILTKAEIADVNKKEINDPGRYELIQVERPHGYLLGQGFEDKEMKKPLTKVVVDFPKIGDDGQIAKDQVYNVEPKFEKAQKEFNLTKTGDDGKALAGVEFNVYALKYAADNEYKAQFGIPEGKAFSDKEVKDKIRVATGTSDSNGKVAWNGGKLILREGSYYLEESNVPEGYGRRGYFLTLAAKEGKDLTAATPEDFEFKITNAYAGSKTVATEKDGVVTLKNYQVPNGKGGDAKMTKAIANIGEATEVQDNVKYDKIATLKAKEHGQFKINFKTPRNLEDYKALSYEDTLRAEYKLVANSIKVKAGEEVNPAWVKVTTAGQNITITIVDEKEATTAAKAGTEVIVEFVVSVNRDVAVHGSDVDNGLKAIYKLKDSEPVVDPNGNDPTPDPNKPVDPKPTPNEIPDTEKPKAHIINTVTTIYSKDKTSKDPVDGAKFIIEKKDPNGDWKKVETPELKTIKGKTSVEDLDPGDYRIVNTTPADGYKKKGVPQEFNIPEKPANDTDKTIVTEKTFYYDKDDKAGLLPSTGTLGMIPYVALAGVLVGVFMVLRKRKETEAHTTK